MLDLCAELKKIEVAVENGRALAVLGYAQASLSKQRYLREKYVAYCAKTFPESNIKLADIEGESYDEPLHYESRADYADEERDRTRNISNHDRTEDERLDDPRHTERRDGPRR
jgi:hypothetical protein